jgi:hypothetical protein
VYRIARLPVREHNECVGKYCPDRDFRTRELFDESFVSVKEVSKLYIATRSLLLRLLFFVKHFSAPPPIPHLMQIFNSRPKQFTYKINYFLAGSLEVKNLFLYLQEYF